MIKKLEEVYLSTENYHSCTRYVRTYMTVQRQFTCKLHTGEDNEWEFLLQFVKNSIFITSWLISSRSLRRLCGEQICKVLDHEPEGDAF